MSIEESRLSDYELAQSLKKEVSFGEIKIRYMNAINEFNKYIKFASKLKDERIKYLYKEDENTSYYYFESDADCKEPFYSHEGNRDRSNELAIYFKNNIRRMLNEKNIEYRAQKQNFETKVRKLAADEYEKTMQEADIVDAVNKTSFLDHEYEFFLKKADYY